MHLIGQLALHKCAAAITRKDAGHAEARENWMQMIEAIIQPERLDAVKTALATLGITGITALESKGFGRQCNQTVNYRGMHMAVEFCPKVLLKLCVKDHDASPAVNAIVNAGRTGKVGDGKVFVYPVSDAVRIRTGELNELAL
jgi:nitrogen regulatory protein PII